MTAGSKWASAVAVVTGAGSGIGRALSVELARRGAIVYASDIDGRAVEKVAGEIGSNARAKRLDVRDASAVAGYVADIEREAGRVDYLFNNAGVGIGGEAQDLSLAHWERTIDVNLRGVVHGIHAVYPGMVRRRSGHIVNVASIAGLGPVPMLTPYAMTKHGVVGLSTSLRLEAEAYGVRVSVLCPGVIETPILDKGNPADLPPLPWLPDVRQFLTKLAGAPYPAEKLASETLDAVAKNRAVIVAPTAARVAVRLGRFLPVVVEARFRSLLADVRSTKPE